MTRLVDDAETRHIIMIATEKLRHRETPVRMEGIRSLYELAQGSRGLREHICDALSSYLRTYTQGYAYIRSHTERPAPEIQLILDLLTADREDNPFRARRLDLSGAYLAGANLEDALLVRACLKRIQLQKANLIRSSFIEADLSYAQCQGADLSFALFIAAHMVSTQFQAARLPYTRWHRASLKDVQFHGADMFFCQFDMAELIDVHFHGADLEEARMRAAHMQGVQMQGARLLRTQMQGTESRRIQVPLETDILVLQQWMKRQRWGITDLSQVVFKGGLSINDPALDRLAALCREGWIELYVVDRLKSIYAAHSCPPVSGKNYKGIQEGSGFHTGPLTEDMIEEIVPGIGQNIR